MKPAEMVSRYANLRRLADEVDLELTALRDAMRVAGVPILGRPRVRNTHTPDEAREAHRRYAAGEQTAWVIAGHRQYMRVARRRSAERREGA